MRDCSKEMLELQASRPKTSTKEAIEFCLRSLYADKEHIIDDTVAGCCTYEELIGALLLARDSVKQLETTGCAY